MTDYCRHLTKCADAVCSYRQVANEVRAAERARIAALVADLRALREQWRRGDTMVSRDHAAVLGQVLDRHALKDDS